MNLFTVKAYIKKYQNESGSYYDKYVFKVNRSRSKQHKVLFEKKYGNFEQAFNQLG